MPELSLNGRRIAYRAEGAGPLVILLHCSSSHSGQWKPYMAALADRFRLVAPDLHGYGRSDPLPDDGSAWFHHDGLIPAALLAAEGADRAHLVGHSLGGATGFYAAVRDARPWLSLTMIEPVLFALLNEAGDPLAADHAELVRALTPLFAQGRHEEASRTFVDFWSGPGAWAATPAGVRDYIRATIRRVDADWRGMDAGHAGQARLADAAALALPVQLITGTASRPDARAIARHLVAANPAFRQVAVAGADHMAAVTDPGKFIGPVAGFLDEIEKRGA